MGYIKLPRWEPVLIIGIHKFTQKRILRVQSGTKMQITHTNYLFTSGPIGNQDQTNSFPTSGPIGNKDNNNKQTILSYFGPNRESGSNKPSFPTSGPIGNKDDNYKQTIFSYFGPNQESGGQ